MNETNGVIETTGAQQQASGPADIHANVNVNVMAQSAWAYAQCGCPVFPLRPGTKLPATPNGLKDARTDEAGIAAMFANGACNIGLCTGRGLTVIDIDAKNMSADDVLGQWLQGRVLPETYTVQTPSGGRHYYFRTPPDADIRNSASKLAKNVDVRGEGGYVVAPPSYTAKGAYTVLKHLPLADAPEWLVAMLKPQDRRGLYSGRGAGAAPDTGDDAVIAGETLQTWVDARVNQALRAIAHAPEGSRNDELNKQSHWIGRTIAALNPDTAVLQAYFDRIVQAALHTGLDAAECCTTAKSGLEAGLKDPARPPTALAAVQGQDVDGIVIMPSHVSEEFGTTITESARTVFRRLAANGKLYRRGASVVQLRATADGAELAVVQPQQFCSMVEAVGKPCAWVTRNRRATLSPTVVSADVAARLLACEDAAAQLPEILGVYAASPICKLPENAIAEARKGYDPDTRTLVVGHGAEDIPYDEAVALLKSLFDDFQFVSEGDRARAMCAVITPALKFGGWLVREAPMFVIEADDSQAGKGYMTKLIAAIYGETFADITQRSGGVGSIDESIDAALISGKPFLRFDNLRGRINSPRLESIMTALAPVPCRAPYAGAVLVDPSRIVLLATSNGMEGTRDLANRSCIIRIRKRKGAEFRKFPEGDLLDHVAANRGKYLGAVHAVIRKWHADGCPASAESRHDMRTWVKMLDGIVRGMGLDHPMEGHEPAKVRTASPALAWLRNVASEVEAVGEMMAAVKASRLAELCVDCSDTCSLPGTRTLMQTMSLLDAARLVGSTMSAAFRTTDTPNLVIVDEYFVYRLSVEEYVSAESRYRKQYYYVFSKNKLADAQLQVFVDEASEGRVRGHMLAPEWRHGMAPPRGVLPSMDKPAGPGPVAVAVAQNAITPEILERISNPALRQAMAKTMRGPAPIPA